MATVPTTALNVPGLRQPVIRLEREKLSDLRTSVAKISRKSSDIKEGEELSLTASSSKGDPSKPSSSQSLSAGSDAIRNVSRHAIAKPSQADETHSMIIAISSAKAGTQDEPAREDAGPLSVRRSQAPEKSWTVVQSPTNASGDLQGAESCSPGDAKIAPLKLSLAAVRPSSSVQNVTSEPLPSSEGPNGPGSTIEASKQIASNPAAMKRKRRFNVMAHYKRKKKRFVLSNVPKKIGRERRGTNYPSSLRGVSRRSSADTGSMSESDGAFAVPSDQQLKEKSDADDHVEVENIRRFPSAIRKSNVVTSPKRIAKSIEANLKKKRFRATPVATVQDITNRVALSDTATLLKPCRCTESPLENPERVYSASDRCEALDYLDGLVVCCLEEPTKQLVRPSFRIPYRRFCRLHSRRLTEHLCCPFCGVFCTQGEFMVCEAEPNTLHAFHEVCAKVFFRGCSGSVLCPHCVNLSPTFMVRRWGLALNPLSSDRFNRLVVLYPRPGMLPRRNTLPEMDWDKAAQLPPSILDKVRSCVTLSTNDLNRIRRGLDAVRKRPTGGRQNLYEAAASGHIENVIRLLKSEANVDEVFPQMSCRRAIHGAAEKGHLAVIFLLDAAGATLDARDSDFNTPLMLAAANDYVDCVLFLLERGCSPLLKGAAGMTALHVAARNGCEGTCQAILAASKNPKSLLDIPDDGGYPPLMWSAEYGSINLLQHFLALGADYRIRDLDCNTGLHWAGFSGSYPCVKTMLEVGIPVNAQNHQGDTALHIAARRDHGEATFLLLQWGAASDIKNARGATPREIATLLSDRSNLHAWIGLTAVINKNGVDLTRADVPDSVRDPLLAMEMEADFPSAGVELFREADVSNGRELYPISWYNSVDDEEFQAKSFVYIKSNVDLWRLPSSRTSHENLCRCSDDCLSNCFCTNSNPRFPCAYDEYGRARIEVFEQENPIIVECGKQCKCDFRQCKNRVVQKGLGGPLQVFKTERCGWGVRPIHAFPARSFVCTFSGELLTEMEASVRKCVDYQLVLPKDEGDESPLIIDARKFGNVGRFINHSCNPNLVVIRVVDDFANRKTPMAALFAVRDIAPGEELTLNYGDEFWVDKDYTCECGSERCGYRRFGEDSGED